MTANETAAKATEILDAIDHQKRLVPFGGIELPQAYAVVAEMKRLRVARGEKVMGRKIGFTNRTIWDEYKVFAPIWGYMYDTTIEDVSATRNVDLAKFAEPRLEPEIAFGFGRSPEAGMSPAQILDCIEWAAHGFEIVQSHYPGWKFSAPDTVANNALHGAYFLGEKIPVSDDRAAWLDALADFEIALYRNGERIDSGHARNVLDGPLFAIRHLLDLLKDDPHNAPVAPGEIITTGTVTKAWPVAGGETWRTEVRGLDVPGIEISFR
ncbi:MAG TPA: fumarylacetoacetate hydrolase family protein [Xanthobacteraceae bacterium]|nr:fumarylacetoacetate hydrolase family protein [Xanthobacteraceae bacterium]